GLARRELSAAADMRLGRGHCIGLAELRLVSQVDCVEDASADGREAASRLIKGVDGGVFHARALDKLIEADDGLGSARYGSRFTCAVVDRLLSVLGQLS